MPLSVAEMEAQYCDPDTGSIHRRWLRRMLNGIVAVGPSARPAPPPEPTKGELQARAERDAEMEQQYRATVEAEITALDRHAADVSERIEVLESTWAASFALQEFRRERRMLLELRQMIAEDLDRGPIVVDRDGRPIDDRTRRYVKFRAAELRDSHWRAAEREAASGDHREARRHRIDSLRSRMLAEAEMHWRPTLPGYGLRVWT